MTSLSKISHSILLPDSASEYWCSWVLRPWSLSMMDRKTCYSHLSSAQSGLVVSIVDCWLSCSLCWSPSSHSPASIFPGGHWKYRRIVARRDKCSSSIHHLTALRCHWYPKRTTRDWQCLHTIPEQHSPMAKGSTPLWSRWIERLVAKRLRHHRRSVLRKVLRRWYPEGDRRSRWYRTTDSNVWFAYPIDSTCSNSAVEGWESLNRRVCVADGHRVGHVSIEYLLGTLHRIVWLGLPVDDLNTAELTRRRIEQNRCSCPLEHCSPCNQQRGKQVRRHWSEWEVDRLELDRWTQQPDWNDRLNIEQQCGCAWWTEIHQKQQMASSIHPG